ncbi:MAG: hypothetical protein ACREQZ_03090, partial [Woeseiaceae bacterium]
QPSRWTFHLGNDLREYSGAPEQVINRIADQLAAEYAFSGDAPIATVSLTVSGISSLADYGAVQKIMEGISQIERFRIDTVAGDRIRYTVHVYGGVDRLGGALERSGKLRARDDLVTYPGEQATYPEFDVLDFVYQPSPMRPASQ